MYVYIRISGRRNLESGLLIIGLDEEYMRIIYNIICIEREREMKNHRDLYTSQTGSTLSETCINISPGGCYF